MKKIALVTLAIVFVAGTMVMGSAYAEKDRLVFGAIAVGKVSKVRKSLTPFMKYISDQIGAEIVFETGKDYLDTINKFQSGYFDFGYIGPSPYIIATQPPYGPDTFNIIGTFETNHKPYFYAVIIAAKDNAQINAISDLNGKKFAFGSRQSTLSCYLPCKMLIDAGMFDKLSSYDFLGKHDKVAQYVAKGAFDAGGIKIAVAEKNLKRVKIIAKSEPVYDFLMIAHRDMDRAQFEKIKTAVLNLKDPSILGSIKKGGTGFIATDDTNYDNLRQIMTQVDQVLPK